MPTSQPRHVRRSVEGSSAGKRSLLVAWRAPSLLNCDQFAFAIGIYRQPFEDFGPHAVPSDTTSLFIEHRGSLVEYATRIVGSRAHAEDVVQEAWLRFDEV